MTINLSFKIYERLSSDRLKVSEVASEVDLWYNGVLHLNNVNPRECGEDAGHIFSKAHPEGWLHLVFKERCNMHILPPCAQNDKGFSSTFPTSAMEVAL